MICLMKVSIAGYWKRLQQWRWRGGGDIDVCVRDGARLHEHKRRQVLQLVAEVGLAEQLCQHVHTQRRRQRVPASQPAHRAARRT